MRSTLSTRESEAKTRRKAGLFSSPSTVFAPIPTKYPNPNPRPARCPTGEMRALATYAPGSPPLASRVSFYPCQIAQGGRKRKHQLFFFFLPDPPPRKKKERGGVGMRWGWMAVLVRHPRRDSSANRMICVRFHTLYFSSLLFLSLSLSLSCLSPAVSVLSLSRACAIVLGRDRAFVRCRLGLPHGPGVY